MHRQCRCLQDDGRGLLRVKRRMMEPALLEAMRTPVLMLVRWNGHHAHDYQT